MAAVLACGAGRRAEPSRAPPRSTVCGDTPRTAIDVTVPRPPRPQSPRHRRAPRQAPPPRRPHHPSAASPPPPSPAPSSTSPRSCGRASSKTRSTKRSDAASSTCPPSKRCSPAAAGGTGSAPPERRSVEDSAPQTTRSELEAAFLRFCDDHGIPPPADQRPRRRLRRRRPLARAEADRRARRLRVPRHDPHRLRARPRQGRRPAARRLPRAAPHLAPPPRGTRAGCGDAPRPAR